MKRTTEECMEDLRSKLPTSDRERGRFYAPFAEYCGVNASTVGRWFSRKQLPLGEPLLRLRHYLAKRGYAVAELESLNPLIKELGRLVADKVVDLDQTSEEIGYSTRDMFLRMAIRGQVPVSERLAKIREILRRHQIAVTSTPAAAGPTSVNKKAVDTKQTVVETLVALVLAATPLAELVLSDQFTAEERQTLRSRAGGDGIYRFSNMMDRLCSETARERIGVYRGRN